MKTIELTVSVNDVKEKELDFITGKLVKLEDGNIVGESTKIYKSQLVKDRLESLMKAMSEEIEYTRLTGKDLV